MRRTVAIIAALFPLSISSALSQSTAPPDIGLEAYHEYHGGDIDEVNLDSGTLTLRIPVLSYPQRGNTLKLDFAIGYNGSGRTYEKSTCIQGKCIYGWLPTSFSYYGLAMTPHSQTSGPALFDTQDIGLSVKSTQTGSSPPSYFTQVSWYTTDGASHLAGQTSTGQTALDGSGFQGGFTYSGSGTETCTWDCNLPAVVSEPYLMGTHNGITYIGSSNTGYRARVDADGNYIVNNGSIVDTVGRGIPIPPVDGSVSGRCASGATESVTWTPPGFSEPYTFCYQNITLVGNASDLALTSIVLPNGQSWGFQYNEQLSGCPVSNGANIGDITQITFPTGGTISYTYTCLTPFGTQTTPYYTTAVATRTVNANDGSGAHEWTYSYNITSSSITTTVTDPLGNVTTHVMNSSTAQRIETHYNGGTNGQVMKTITKSYNSQYSTGVGLPMYPTIVQVTLENGQSMQTNYTYCCDFSFLHNAPVGDPLYPTAASYGKVTDEKLYDYSGTMLRETATSYLFQSNSNYLNPGFFDLASTKTIYDANSNEIAQTTYGYDETAPVNSGIASLGGHMTTPIYAVYGHQTSATQWLNTGPSNPKTTTSYYDFGSPYQVSDPLGHTTSTYYCTGSSPTTLPCSASAYLGAVPTVVYNALGQQTSYSYRTDTGQLLTTTDPNGQSSTNAYSDSMNRLTSVTYPDGGATSLQYNDAGQIGVTLNEKISGSLTRETQVIVDGLGRESENISLSDPSGATYTYTTYDALGRKYQVWNPTRCNPPTSNCGESTWGVTTYQYDALNRETLMIPPDGNSVTDNFKTSYSGDTKTVTDEAGNYRTTTTDALGRITQVSEGSAGYITDYFYDPLNDLTCVEQHGGVSGTGCSSPPADDSSSLWRVRRFTYDSLGRLLSAKNPETGTITYGYNADSVMTSKTDARNVTISYIPDALHRITQKSYSDSEPTITYSYDAFVSGSNYGIGRLTRMTDASGSTSWTYDAMGRKWSESKTINSITKTTNWTYYYDGSDQQITYPAESASQGGHSVVLSVTPNGLGQPVTVTDTTNGITYAQSLVYAPAGELGSAVYGHSGSYAGITQTNSYNSRGQPLTLQACGLGSCTGSNYLLNLSYNYGLGSNDNGSVQGITNNKNGARNQSFSYDALNRLTQATSGSGAWGISFSYDAWGNLWQTNTAPGTDSNPMPLNQGINQQSNQFQLLGYTYDAAGNVLADGSGDNYCSGAAYSWNAEEQISCGYGTSYTYDGDGGRVEKNGGSSTPTLYWGGLVESDLSGNVTSEYIFVNGKRIARRDAATGTVYYYFDDMLGSSNVVASSSGALVNESDFYPFGGESVVTQGLSNQKYKFIGKERDAETGLDDFGARYYNSNTARFQSPDWANKAEPVPYAKIDNPQTLNLYSYVENNPESYPDLDGHEDPGSGGADSGAGAYGSDGSAGEDTSSADPNTKSGTAAKAQAANSSTVVYKPGVPQASPDVSKMLTCTAKCSGETLRVTSTSEAIPQHPAGTPHRKGEAADVTVKAGTAKKVLACAATCGARFAQDEGAHPIPGHTTGPHVHLQTVPGKRGGRGDLPKSRIAVQKPKKPE